MTIIIIIIIMSFEMRSEMKIGTAQAAGFEKELRKLKHVEA
jgi:hypothetical protein